jgi:hypothetical protein
MFRLCGCRCRFGTLAHAHEVHSLNESLQVSTLYRIPSRHHPRPTFPRPPCITRFLSLSLSLPLSLATDTVQVAVAEDRLEATKYLLRRGVSWRKLTDKGKSCEEIACERNPAGELCELFGNMRRSVEYEENRQDKKKEAKQQAADGADSDAATTVATATTNNKGAKAKILKVPASKKHNEL